jgi:hypothetical protein
MLVSRIFTKNDIKTKREKKTITHIVIQWIFFFFFQVSKTTPATALPTAVAVLTRDLAAITVTALTWLSAPKKTPQMTQHPAI